MGVQFSMIKTVGTIQMDLLAIAIISLSSRIHSTNILRASLMIERPVKLRAF